MLLQDSHFKRNNTNNNYFHNINTYHRTLWRLASHQIATVLWQTMLLLTQTFYADVFLRGINKASANAVFEKYNQIKE